MVSIRNQDRSLWQPVVSGNPNGLSGFNRTLLKKYANPNFPEKPHLCSTLTRQFSKFLKDARGDLWRMLRMLVFSPLSGEPLS